ncbi:MAG: hypothetical protein K8I82_17565, partial [Anaerolineae bacterium]|nr:hypothetical protein [Anaerolineae bacterium]
MPAVRHLKNLWLLIPLLAAFGMYAPSVRLPFFSDDVIHLRGVTTVSSEYILTHADLGMYYANNYYRPVVNLILRTQHVLGIEPAAPVWHVLMVLTHMLNTALVGLLVRQMRLSRFAVFTAMLIFAVYPFSWQVVVWVLAWFHSLVLTVILLSVTAAIRFFRRPNHYGMLMLAVVAGSLAPFIHENGLFASVLIVLLLMLIPHPTPMRWRALAVLVPLGGAAAIYLYLWTTITGRQLPLLRFLPAVHVFSGSMMVMVVIPHRYVTTTLTFNTWLKKLLIVLVMLMGAGLLILSLRGQGIWTAYHLKAAYLTQGMSFPFQWAAGYTSLSAEKQAWLGTMAFTALWSVVFSLVDNRTRRVLLIGMGWFAVMCVLPMFYLGEGY